MPTDPYEVLLHPYVTERTMDLIDMHNSLEFIVHKRATKPQIKRAFEKVFDVRVAAVNTRHTKHGKHAIIKLTKEYKAEDIGTRIGIF